MEWQPVLEQSTHFSSILAVAITNWEEVAVLQTHDVGRGDVSILVGFVWIVRSYTSLCREGELGHHVAYLVWFCCCWLSLGWHWHWGLGFLSSFNFIQVSFYICLRLNTLVALSTLRVRLFVRSTGWPWGHFLVYALHRSCLFVFKYILALVGSTLENIWRHISDCSSMLVIWGWLRTLCLSILNLVVYLIKRLQLSKIVNVSILHLSCVLC